MMLARRASKALILFLAALMLLAPEAHAAASLGDVMTNVRESFEKFPNILSAVAYISGIFLAVWGIFKFKDHVDNPYQHPLSDGVKRFLAGGMLLALPFMAEAVKGNLMGAGGATATNPGGYHPPPGGTGMDQMVYNLMSNIQAPMEKLLIAFAYISAIALLVVGISRLTKTMQEGPRGPAGMGTLMTFIAAGALFAFGDMIGTFSQSVFGSPTVSTYATISATVLTDATANAKTSSMIEAVMAFIMIVGFIAFLRGWFVLKAFADGGNTNATLAQALTFLFGGALAINLGDLINVLQATLGISGITFS